MASDILKLDSILSLTADEVVGMVIPQTVWDKGAGAYRLTLVGRLLSHRTVLFEALKGSLVHLIQATRGMVVHKVSESRFCLIFNHPEDLHRFSDLGNLTPYGAWLRTAGPSRRLGMLSIVIRPTYVWHSSSLLRSASGSPRGAQVFGTFSTAGGGAERGLSELGVAPPSPPVCSKRLRASDIYSRQQRFTTASSSFRPPVDMGCSDGTLGCDSDCIKPHNSGGWVGPSPLWPDLFARPISIDPFTHSLTLGPRL
ncbi:hypothetical protein Salat_0182300 [Sesamum alatum]|uniref:DUF4283 domain-containing protein n=1 Tax=Sesamum alatum TaxID=300844 RepID=A0AAE1YXA3_9LAMI|nr:hypothetical protein Salat_0182300 [Sesamum alatum]